MGCGGAESAGPGHRRPGGPAGAGTMSAPAAAPKKEVDCLSPEAQKLVSAFRPGCAGPGVPGVGGDGQGRPPVTGAQRAHPGVCDPDHTRTGSRVGCAPPAAGGKSVRG